MKLIVSDPGWQELGDARLEAIHRTPQEQEQGQGWKPTRHPNLFKAGSCWNQCVRIRVPDFAASVGFFVDGLGFEVNALCEDYAMFTDKEKSWFFAIEPTPQGAEPAPPDAVKLEFMIEDIVGVARSLEARGLAFERPPASIGLDSPMYSALFRSPGGLAIELWGMVGDSARDAD